MCPERGACAVAKLSELSERAGVKLVAENAFGFAGERRCCCEVSLCYKVVKLG